MNQEISCPHCGEKWNDKFEERERGVLRCWYCGNNFFIEKAEEIYKKLKECFDGKQIDEYNKALRNLHNAAGIRFPDRRTVLDCAQAVKRFNPEHAAANLFELLLTEGTQQELGNF